MAPCGHLQSHSRPHPGKGGPAGGCSPHHYTAGWWDTCSVQQGGQFSLQAVHIPSFKVSLNCLLCFKSFYITMYTFKYWTMLDFLSMCHPKSEQCWFQMNSPLLCKQTFSQSNKSALLLLTASLPNTLSYQPGETQ